VDLVSTAGSRCVPGAGLSRGLRIGCCSAVPSLRVLGPRIRLVAPHGHGLTSFLRHRYGRVFHGYVVFLSVLYMFTFVTAELTAAGSVTALLSDIPASVVVALVAAVTLL